MKTHLLRLGTRAAACDGTDAALVFSRPGEGAVPWDPLLVDRIRSLGRLGEMFDHLEATLTCQPCVPHYLELKAAELQRPV